MVVGILIFISRGYHAAERIGKTALKNQEDTTGEYFGMPIHSTFTIGKRYNQATTDGPFGVRIDRDANNSYILGEVVGEKSNEFIDGFLRGKKRDSRHEE